MTLACSLQFLTRCYGHVGLPDHYSLWSHLSKNRINKLLLQHYIHLSRWTCNRNIKCKHSRTKLSFAFERLPEVWLASFSKGASLHRILRFGLCTT